jgi:hypothetical protein
MMLEKRRRCKRKANIMYSQKCSEILQLLPTQGVGNISHIEKTDMIDIAYRGRE